eukprot:5727416-Pyramimonas_sp.AAC.1
MPKCARTASSTAPLHFQKQCLAAIFNNLRCTWLKTTSYPLLIPHASLALALPQPPIQIQTSVLLFSHLVAIELERSTRRRSFAEATTARQDQWVARTAPSLG